MTKKDTATVEKAQPQPQQETFQLTVDDLRGLATIIDLASSRGAFKAAEMAQIGMHYNKLAQFIEIASQNSSATTAPGGGA